LESDFFPSSKKNPLIFLMSSWGFFSKIKGSKEVNNFKDFVLSLQKLNSENLIPNFSLTMRKRRGMENSFLFHQSSKIFLTKKIQLKTIEVFFDLH